MTNSIINDFHIQQKDIATKMAFIEVVPITFKNYGIIEKINKLITSVNFKQTGVQGRLITGSLQLQTTINTMVQDRHINVFSSETQDQFEKFLVRDICLSIQDVERAFLPASR